MYFQITFDSKVVGRWFRNIQATVLVFCINHFITKRRKRIIILWLSRKDLKATRQSRKEQMERMFGNSLVRRNKG